VHPLMPVAYAVNDGPVLVGPLEYLVSVQIALFVH
jgi:hypothetical protein